MGKRLLLLVALWWAFCWFVYAHVPPSPDDTDIDYMGWMLLRGGVQYVDFIDMNWPGGVWLHALSTLLFGTNLMSWRILDFAIAIVAMILLYDLIARAYGRTAATWLAFIYPAIYVTLGIWMAGQRDAVAGHGLIVAMAAHARAWERQQLRWQALAGLALGLSILVKPTIGFAGPLLVLHGIVWSIRGAGVMRALVHGAIAGASALLVLIGALGVQLLQGAPLEAVIEGGYLLNRLAHNIATVEERNVFIGMRNVTLVILHWVTALAIAGCALLMIDRGRSLANKTLLLVPIAAGVINYYVQLKYFEYHL
jgi:4-amino-4-deoxy-L-arabinose transferase-like glycosyltransferase